MLTPAPVLTATSSVTTTATQTASLTQSGDGCFWYVPGFEITYSGATAGSIVQAALAGVQGGPLKFNIAVPTGVTTGGALMVSFPVALAGIDASTAVTLSVPAFGAGSTKVDANLHGFKGNKTLGS